MPLDEPEPRAGRAHAARQGVERAVSDDATAVAAVQRRAYRRADQRARRQHGIGDAARIRRIAADAAAAGEDGRAAGHGDERGAAAPTERVGSAHDRAGAATSERRQMRRCRPRRNRRRRCRGCRYCRDRRRRRDRRCRPSCRAPGSRAASRRRRRCRCRFRRRPTNSLARRRPESRRGRRTPRPRPDATGPLDNGEVAFATAGPAPAFAEAFRVPMPGAPPPAAHGADGNGAGQSVQRGLRRRDRVLRRVVARAVDGAATQGGPGALRQCRHGDAPGGAAALAARAAVRRHGHRRLPRAAARRRDRLVRTTAATAGDRRADAGSDARQPSLPRAAAAAWSPRGGPTGRRSPTGAEPRPSPNPRSRPEPTASRPSRHALAERRRRPRQAERRTSRRSRRR